MYDKSGAQSSEDRPPAGTQNVAPPVTSRSRRWIQRWRARAQVEKEENTKKGGPNVHLELGDLGIPPEQPIRVRVTTQKGKEEFHVYGEDLFKK